MGVEGCVRCWLRVEGRGALGVLLYILYNFLKAIYALSTQKNVQLNWGKGVQYFLDHAPHGGVTQWCDGLTSMAL